MADPLLLGQGVLMLLVVAAPYLESASGVDTSAFSALMDSSVTAPIGWAICAVAGALIVFGGTTLGDSLTGNPKPIEGGQLKTDGVYGLCRHPMYGGLVSGGLGMAVLAASPGRLLGTLALYALLSAKTEKEEKFLVETYPDYPEYRLVVKNKFFPGLPASKP